MILEKIVCNFMGTNCYLFGDSNSKEIAIIDPGGNPVMINNRINSRDYKPKCIILTHGHPDHTGAANLVRREWDIPIFHHPKESPLIDFRDTKSIKEPDVVKIGSEELHVLDTPGHSPGGICLASYDNKILFTGDTLFRSSIGRTDLGGGSFDRLMNSIKTKIMRNPKISDDFKIYPGHMDESTIQTEKKANMYRRDFL
ncbi:MAG: MBL fold metallo-hydrolase [Candidatus Lokiarchaeota archaeon]|nr:MBL fold metallo-hydrolase [Candidatus Lokiarchaeota archaeon]